MSNKSDFFCPVSESFGATVYTIFTSHSATNYLHSYHWNFIIGSSIPFYLIAFSAIFVTLRLLARHLPNILLGCAEINIGFGIKVWKERTRIDTVMNIFHHSCFHVIEHSYYCVLTSFTLKLWKLLLQLLKSYIKDNQKVLRLKSGEYRRIVMINSVGIDVPGSQWYSR